MLLKPNSYRIYNHSYDADACPIHIWPSRYFHRHHDRILRQGKQQSSPYEVKQSLPSLQPGLSALDGWYSNGMLVLYSIHLAIHSWL